MALKPPLLKTGDTIGLITPGSPLDANTINACVKYLKDMGFNVVFGKYVYAAQGITAATPQQRAGDVMDMFRNPRIKMILPTRGGTGILSILPHLDFDVIKKNPKIISGYSDNTVLLNSLYQFSNLITFHSIMLINFNQFFKVTSALNSAGPIQNPPEIPLKSLVQGNVTGPIVGGNMTSLVNTLGTPYKINTKGKILFLEDTHTPDTMIYRYLTQFAMSGKFKDCLGIIIGQCSNCPESYHTSFEDLIYHFLVPVGKPLMINLATGHGYYKAAIPIGSTVNLNTINKTLTILEPTVSSS